MSEERLPTEFSELRDRVKELISANQSLIEEKRRYAEDILFKERQIRELKDKYERSERSRKEAYQRISTILRKLDGIKSDNK